MRSALELAGETVRLWEDEGILAPEGDDPNEVVLGNALELAAGILSAIADGTTATLPAARRAAINAIAQLQAPTC